MRLERFQQIQVKTDQKSAQLLPYLQNMHQLMEKREELSKEGLEQLLHFRIWSMNTEFLYFLRK